MSRRAISISVIATLSILVTIVALNLRRENRLYFEARARERQQRDQAKFDKVKAGNEDVLVFSPELVVMLAHDADCIRNLKRIELFGDDLSQPGYDEIRKLSSVKHISFDESVKVESIMPSIKEMLSLDSIYFYCVAMTPEIQSQIASMPNLKHIRHGSLGQSDLADLARKLPNVVVEVDEGPTGEPVRITPRLP